MNPESFVFQDFILIFILLLASAFFSGTETAIFSLSGVKVSRIGESKNKRMANLKILLKNPELLLSVILLGNLTVNIFFSHFAHQLLSRFIPEKHADVIILIIITVILLVAGEILPKVIALRYADKWSLNAALFTVLWMKLTKCLAWPINLVTQRITAFIPEVKHKYNEAELLDTLKYAFEDNIIKENEYKILQRTIHFYHDTAYSIMEPKSSVLMLPSTVEFTRARKMIIQRKSQFVLIFNEKDNRITGYVSARAIVTLMIGKKAQITNLMQPLIFLPKTMLLNEVLEELIKNRLEVAAVIDEMGEFSGIVTIKEIFHTLLGNLDIEQGLHIHGIQRVNIFPMQKNIYRILGLTTLHEFNEYFKTDLVSANSETISGFLIERLDGYPRTNTVFQYKNLKFYQMMLRNNVISHVLLHIEYES